MQYIAANAGKKLKKVEFAAITIIKIEKLNIYKSY